MQEILVVEDEMTTAILLEELLENNGFQVTGIAATGLEAIKLLRRMAPHVRAIVCIGYFDDPVLGHFAEYGFCGALPKPYRESDLEKVLWKAMGA